MAASEEHYREAERLIKDAESGADAGAPYFLDDALPGLFAAQVHATLALAEAVQQAVVEVKWARQ